MIKVLHTYSGRLTEKQKIQPGVYDENDTALFGIAAYLVENGHAVYTQEALSQPVVEQTSVNHNLQLQIQPGRVAVVNGELVATKLEPEEKPVSNKRKK